MEMKQLIGMRIKELRRIKGLSQEQLSEKIAMSSKYLSSIERGKENPTLDAFIKLAQALDVEIAELFSYTAEMSPREQTRFIADLMKSGDKGKLKLAVKLIRALYL